MVKYSCLFKELKGNNTTHCCAWLKLNGIKYQNLHSHTQRRRGRRRLHSPEDREDAGLQRANPGNHPHRRPDGFRSGEIQSKAHV